MTVTKASSASSKQTAFSRIAARKYASLEQTGKIEQTPDAWSEWLTRLFPRYVASGFAPHHERFWEWVWAIGVEERPHPFVAIWPRGHAKSTSAEMAIVALGAFKLRSYVLYISGTQEQADDHVENIATMLESEEIARYHPELSSRKIGKYGNAKGWRRNRLRTASGLTVDAIGLDSAARGAKVDEYRPGFMVIDDIDGEQDTPKTTEKKIRSLTRKVLPAGADNLGVLVAQNLVHSNSTVARLADGRADFLADRIVDGPLAVIQDLQYEERDGRAVITGGTPTWDGMGIERCQEILDDEGLSAFLVERMQRKESMEHVFDSEWWNGKNRYDPDDKQLLNRTIGRWVAFDTANKDKETNAYTACVVGELTQDYKLLVKYVHRERVKFDALPDLAIREVGKFVKDRKLREVLIEDAASGIQLLQVLNTTGPEWIKNRTVPIKPKGKEDSWNAAALWCARGMVLLPEPSTSVPWLHEFESELFSLPGSEFKDQADAFAMLVNHVEERYGCFSQRWNVTKRQQTV